MSEILTETEVLTTQINDTNAIVKMNVTDQAIAEMKEKYSGLTINGIEDKAGYKAVYEARQIVKKTRTGVQSFAKGLKEKALEWQRKVNAEQARVIGELESIESKLQAEEDRIDAEKEAIKQEEYRKNEEKLQERVTGLSKLGYEVDIVVLKTLTDAQYEKVLENAKQQYELEQIRLAEVAEAQRLEQIKIEAERKELEELRQKNQALQDEMLAAQKKREEEDAARQREIETEKKRVEEAELYRLKAIEDKNKEVERLRMEEEQKAAEAEELAKQAPDREKWMKFSETLSSLALPECSSVLGNDLHEYVKLQVTSLNLFILKSVKKM